METMGYFPRSTPEAEGIASSGILDFVNAVEQHDFPLDAVQGFMLLRHGRLVAEGWWKPYAPEYPHSLFSLSKSFTSSAIGMAVAEGLLTVEDPVLKFFPDDAPANPSDNLRAIRVRHLLSMNTGHDQDTYDTVRYSGEDHWPRVFLSLPVEHAPGSWFRYNTGATYMLSAILSKVTGMALIDYLRPRLFGPLGIQNPRWETDPRGISLGGTGLHVRLEDIAKFGQLYLQKGMWEGQRLLQEAWIGEATRAHSDNSNTQTDPDWRVGYGYQFWRCRHNAYRGDGAFGQYCVVMPEQDVVLAINSGVRDLQLVLDRVWDHLLPAIHLDALPDDPQSLAALDDKLASLALPVPQGQAKSSAAAAWLGKRYILSPNELKLDSIALSDGTLTLRDDRGEHHIAVGSGAWQRGRTSFRGHGDEPVAAIGAWTTDDTYEVELAYTDSEYGMRLRFHFAGSDLQLDVEPNVAWDAPKPATLTGQAAS